MYVELHTSSAFSFLRAASLPESLIERAALLGYPAVALLDRDGVYGAPRFHKAARSAGLRPIIGAELTIEAGSREQGAGSRGSSALFPLSVLIQSQEGYRNLCRLITKMKLRAPKGEGVLTLEDLDGHVHGLVALAGRSLLRSERHGVGGLLDRLVGIFGRAHIYVELQRHLLRDETWDNEMLVSLAEAFRVPVLATNGVRFAAPGARPLHDVLTCIREHTTLALAGRRLVANAERYLKSPAQMARLFEDLPDAVTATRELAERLEFTMQDLGYRFPRYPVPTGETEASFLRKIAGIGARERYRPYHDTARSQIERELNLIEKLDLAGYFLIVWDIVNFCRQQDILVQGRGSAANSAVCYSLGITAVDPVGMELLFERFLSEERGEWPDIDLDLPSGDRRERVIQHVYEKYGQHGAAMTANVISYRGKSAAREVGKALNLDPGQIDRLAKVMHNFEFKDADDSLATNMQTVGVDARQPQVVHFAKLWQQMQDLPRHLGQHSGGMVICQGALSSVVPLENASMPGRVVVQWDKEDCADMGLIKVDLLGLGMMSALQDALTIINTQGTGNREQGTGNGEREHGAAPLVDLAHLPQNDEAVYRMLQTADTVGLFQVESRAQMATLPRLKPVCFYDLVVQVAIIRPGPIVGQMVHPYLDRRAGREPVVYDHPLLEPVLKRTLGVPLFQEQLLRMAMVVAGFTGGQAEDLRRAMGFKRSEQRMKQIEVQLRAGMAERGISGQVADRIVRSIGSFALYGFPESHAASFALIAYASAYLKAHYPAAFYTALLNNQPMGFYHPATLVKDAQRRGVRFTPIDVQESDWDCTVGRDGTIRLGLRFVAGLRADVGRMIEAKGRSREGEARDRGQRPREDLGGVRPSAATATPPLRCPKCGCDDPSMIELAGGRSLAAHVAESSATYGAGSGTSGRSLSPFPVPCSLFCNVCSHQWREGADGRRFRSIEDLIRSTGLRRDEVTVLAEVGALNSLGYDRRSALWQVERVVRPAGELFEEQGAGNREQGSDGAEPAEEALGAPSLFSVPRSPFPVFASPLPEMSAGERLVADYAGTGLTVGPHPMRFRRHELSMKGVVRAIDLPLVKSGRRVRTAGMVITRQRPGTAKGFVFLTLEDETGISNVIIRPDVYARDKAIVVESPFLLVEGWLQVQDGVTAIKAERLQRLEGLLASMAVESHDFR
ncbi:MAG: error-prone DNA polymerase [Acidobacteria bacterium]|nr:error-prone DNA polymerase [Acidobacteriota bacterium]